MKTDLLLLAAVIVLFAIPFALVEPPEGGEAWAGADAQAEGVIGALAPDYQPWIAPLFEPPSGEIESLLFALQAAIGAGILGFVAGRLSRPRAA